MDVTPGSVESGRWMKEASLIGARLAQMLFACLVA